MSALGFSGLNLPAPPPSGAADGGVTGRSVVFYLNGVKQVGQYIEN